MIDSISDYVCCDDVLDSLFLLAGMTISSKQTPFLEFLNQSLAKPAT